MLSRKLFTVTRNVWAGTISTNQTNLTLTTWASSNGWNGSDYAEITINSGVYVYSTDTSIPALSTGNFPNGLKLIVNGFVLGKGGRGGGTSGSTIVPPGAGGNAISLGCNVTIVGGSGGYIAGGGGGGGTGAISSSNGTGGGGGAGGGNGGGGSSGMAETGGGSGATTPGTSGSTGTVRGGGDFAGAGASAGGGGAASTNS